MGFDAWGYATSPTHTPRPPEYAQVKQIYPSTDETSILLGTLEIQAKEDSRDQAPESSLEPYNRVPGPEYW